MHRTHPASTAGREVRSGGAGGFEEVAWGESRSMRPDLMPRGFPVPGQELVYPGVRQLGDTASTSASQACGSTSLSLAVTMRVYIAAARSPPRSEPANSQERLPSAIPRIALSAALFVRQIRLSSRKRVKPSQRLSM